MRFWSGLLPVLASLSVVYTLRDQQVLSGHAKPGILRRFPVGVGGGYGIEELLQRMTEHDMDVWATTPSHIEVYTPPESVLPWSLAGYNHTQTPIPLSCARPQTHTIDGAHWRLGSPEDSAFHASYHTLAEIERFMRELAALHPDLVSLVSLGHTAEGREMWGMAISQKPDRLESMKPRKASTRSKTGRKSGFVIIGAQHAREWIATAASLYVAHALVANASDILESYNFYIIPTANPDGYVHTWEADRFWYKNRMILNPNAECVGVDMNRNWGYKWKPSANTSPPTSPQKSTPKPPRNVCSPWFPGQRPFQAPEVNNIANYVATLPNLLAFLDMRSYGQTLSSPYSYSCKRVAKDAEDQQEAALGITHALRRTHGTSFTTGTLCSMLYRAPGNVVDWMYARAGIKYSYAVHLHDTGTYGFALPPEMIRPVGRETRDMVEYLAAFISRNNK